MSMKGGPKTQKVRYGERVAISGRVNPADAGRTVRLEQAGGKGGFRSVSTAATGTGGTYRFAFKARRSASYRAVSDGTTPTATRRITVVAAIAGASRRHVLGTRAVRVRGKLVPGASGRRVSLQLAKRGGWRTVDTTRTGPGGRFTAAFLPRSPGKYRLRVLFAGDRQTAGAARKLRRIYVYRPGAASWYGPGLYGNATACGGTLTASRLGVANKSLPCGTKVTLRYRGRSVTVPVIDRGPYAAGRDWDLTPATKRKLGFGSTGTVWSTK
jgi:rare lipoprotein A